MSDEPLIIKPETISTTLAAATRMITVLGGGITAILGFIGKRDLAGLADYFQSSAFIPVAGAAAAIATFSYAMWRTWKNKKSLIAVAQAAPNEIATVLPKK